jgi:hypothetical protein
MNPEIRHYMYPHYGTGYMPYPYGTHTGYMPYPYGTHTGYGYSVPLHVYHHYHPHHMVHYPGSQSAGTFAVPIQSPTRLVM